MRLIVDSANPLRNEYGFGIGVGIIYGVPAWVGLPLVAFLSRATISRSQLLVLLAPVAVAAALISVLGVVGSAL
jgi:hypothetical protein